MFAMSFALIAESCVAGLIMQFFELSSENDGKEVK